MTMNNRYYAVRYKTAPNQIRIEKSTNPVAAFRLAFGGPPVVLGISTAQYKDLGTRVAVIQSDTKRIALLKDERGWEDFK